MDERTAIEELETQKKALEKKCESLARIIEISSKTSLEPQEGEEAEKSSKTIDSELENMRRGLKSINKNLKGLGDLGENPKFKELADMMENKMKDMEKLSSIEDRMKNLEGYFEKASGAGAGEGGEKPEEQEGGENIFGGFGNAKVRKKLEKDVVEIRDVFKDFKDSFESRLLSVETRLEEINMKLTPGTIKNLEKFVSSKDKIVDEVVPEKVREEVDKILSSFSFEIESLTGTIKFLTRDLEKSNRGMHHFLKWAKGTEGKIKGIESALEQIQKDIIPR